MAFGIGTVLLGLCCTAFGGITVRMKLKEQRIYRRKLFLTQALQQLGDGEQICGEITEAQVADETLGAVCRYGIEFLGTDGLNRRVELSMQLNLGNRYEVGTPALLRMSPVPIEPLLLPLNDPQCQLTDDLNITVLNCPIDATGRVLLEQDYFALKQYLTEQKKHCSREMTKYGFAALFAGFDLFCLLIFWLYTLL